MEIFNAYEVLDELAEKSKMFQMIRDEFANKDVKIDEMQEQIDDMILQLGDFMLGGM